MRIHAVLATIIGLSGAATTGALAQEGAAFFYKGKTMTILAGSSPGGGVDLYARLLARHLGRHIPGNPNIVVQNMPGAGSLAAARNIYSIAPKDGTQIGVVLSTALFDPLMSGQDLQAYDPRTFNYLGNANADTSVCVVRKDAPVQSYGDLFEKELVVGGTGSGSALVDYPVMERYLLGSKLKLIAGYKGSNEISVAIERNEVQGICGLLWSSAKQQYPQALRADGNVKILVQEDTKASPALVALGAPLVTTFAKTADQKRALAVIFEQGSISRPFMAPPGVPADRVAMLRKAFMETMKDPELLAEAAKQGLDAAPNTGEEVQALVNSVYATPPELIATLRKATEGAH
ncbi:MAG: Tripartite-type tricarboxylate transporter, receptor component TctC [Hyphomicrobiales bacterium]|nr:Tripartite-type tricarboxylate transporter, receptor component TctC [Hyphomicrobiales bacterium]